MLKSPVGRSGTALVAALAVLAFTHGALAQDEDVLERARQAYVEVRDQECLNLANEFLIESPLDARAAELRARVLKRMGRAEEAVRTLERLKDPSLVLRLLLVECLALSGERERAQEMVNEIVQEDPSSAWARVTRTRLLMWQGKWQAALAEINLVREQEPTLADAAVVQGQVYEGLFRLQEAERVYGTFLIEAQEGHFGSHDPHIQIEAVEGLGRVNVNMGRYQQAVGYYEQLVSRVPDQPVYQYLRGVSLSLAGRAEEGLAAIQKAVEMDGDNAAFRSRLAELYADQGRLDDAIAEYSRVLDLPGGDVWVPSMRLMQLYLENGQLDQAVVVAGNLEGLAPDIPELLEAIGQVREKVGNQAAAEEAYRAALEGDPLRYDALWRLGFLLSESEDPVRRAEGQRLLERFQRVSPYLDEIRRLLKELAIVPNNVILQFQLATRFNQAQEYPPAAQLVAQVLQALPNHPFVHATAGCIAANMGRPQQALNFFQRADQILGGRNEDLKTWIDALQKGQALPLPLVFTPALPKAPGDADGAEGADGN